MAEIVVLNQAQGESGGIVGSLTGSDRGVNLAGYAALTLAATGLVAMSAHVSVPLFFTPVPITLQTLAVLFLGLLMGPRWAFVTLTAYLAEGAAGLPVFSPHGLGGVAQLLGPTGGYLLSYPFAAAGAGLLYRWLGGRFAARFSGGRFVAALVSAFVPALFILAAGATWLGVETHQPLQAALAEGFTPFLAGDLFKVCLAAAAATGISRATGRPERPVELP
jgi:biotin transport system substrate-specific component